MLVVYLAQYTPMSTGMGLNIAGVSLGDCPPSLYITQRASTVLLVELKNILPTQIVAHLRKGGAKVDKLFVWGSNFSPF